MQIQPPSGFSASLELDGLPVLVCGGGPAALSVIRRLLDSGAVVTGVAPEIGATFAHLAARGPWDHQRSGRRPRPSRHADCESCPVARRRRTPSVTSRSWCPPLVSQN